jgi:heme-degrading monooxygenase HmoA
MSGPLFTVINTFTLKSGADAEEFERRFRSHVQWMRRQDGFRAHQAVRAIDRPDVYVNVGWWASPDQFRAVLGSEVFQEHAKEFHQVVDVEADPSLNVLRIDGSAAGEHPVVRIERFTVTGDTDAWEAAYGAYARAAARLDGFGHADLAKALMRPGGYTAVVRWSGEQAATAALDLPEYAELTALTAPETLLTTPVVGDRAPGAEVPSAV